MMNEECSSDKISSFNEVWKTILGNGKIPKEVLIECYDKVADIYNTVCPIGSFSAIIDAFTKLNLPKNMRILDLCCGTGRLGQLLQEKGYTNIDGLDCSQKSIDIAEKIGCYKNLYRAFFTEQDNRLFDDGIYDVVFVCNSFAMNHLNSQHFDEITRIIKTGGHFVFKIRDAYLNELDSFEIDIKRKIDEKVWQHAIDMFTVEPVPGYIGPNGSKYQSKHYIVKIAD